MSDVARILGWYRGSYPGRAERFEAALLAVLATVDASPLGYPILEPPDIRAAPLRKFPQSVVYVPVHGDVEVLAIFDGRREPGSWTK
ncbi:MAG: hypothetical protein HOO96_41285 [Polyangiaceae bacterium]|nr:hypothetical protein [Polyangiaceae bacterium]